MKNPHHFKHLHGEPAEVTDEAGYRVEDGIVVDPLSDLRTDSREYGNLTRWHEQTPFERRCEEVAWAALSGPVTIRKKVAA